MPYTAQDIGLLGQDVDTGPKYGEIALKLQAKFADNYHSFNLGEKGDYNYYDHDGVGAANGNVSANGLTLHAHRGDIGDNGGSAPWGVYWGGNGGSTDLNAYTSPFALLSPDIGGVAITDPARIAAEPSLLGGLMMPGKSLVINLAENGNSSNGDAYPDGTMYRNADDHGLTLSLISQPYSTGTATSPGQGGILSQLILDASDATKNSNGDGTTSGGSTTKIHLEIDSKIFGDPSPGPQSATADLIAGALTIAQGGGMDESRLIHAATGLDMTSGPGQIVQQAVNLGHGWGGMRIA